MSGQSVRSAKVSLGYTLSGRLDGANIGEGTWNIGLGMTKILDQGMPTISRTMSLHGASWDVTAPQAGDLVTFASAGIDMQLADNMNLWLNVSAAERDGALTKGAAFGVSMKW